MTSKYNTRAAHCCVETICTDKKLWQSTTVSLLYTQLPPRAVCNRQLIKQALPGTVNPAPCPTAGCCHLVILTAWSQRYCLSILKASQQQQQLWLFFCYAAELLQSYEHRSKHKWQVTRSVAAGFGWHGMPPSASNDTGTALGQYGSDWSHDLATLSLEVMAPLADASRRPPSVYQVWSSQALPFRRYAAGCVSALMGLVTVIFDLLTFKLVCQSHQRMDGRTDRRTDGQNQRLLPPSLWARA